MLISAEHEISNAYKYKISMNSAFSGSVKPIMLFFLFINVKMPTIFRHFNIYEPENFHTQDS